MIELGIIGCGYWGPNLVRNFVEIDNCRVKFISDINRDRLDQMAKKYPEIEKYTDYRKALKDKTVRAVVIATNLVRHYKIAKDVLAAGKDLLIEKPITSKVKEAEHLVSLAGKKKRILMTGHTFLFNKGIKAVKSRLKKKELGNLLYMHAVRTNLGPIREDTNSLWDLASHDISIFLYLLDRMPQSVSARGGSYIKKKREDVVFLTLVFPGGIVGNIHVSWLEPCKVRKLTLIGDKKMLVFDDINTIEPIKIYDKGVIKEKKYDTFGEFQLVLRDGEVRIPKVELSEPLKDECQHFINCVRNRNNSISDGKFGLKVVKVLSAAQKSLKRNGVPIEVE